MEPSQPPSNPPPNIPFSLDELADYFVQNWGEVKMVATGHPLLLIVIVTLTALLTWLVFYFFHKRQLDEIPILERQNALKDDDIKRRDDEIARLKQLLTEATQQKLTESAKSTIKVYNTPSDPNEIIYPLPDGPLWRWDPTVGAIGPFCPKHPQERLGLKSKHVKGIKWNDFERDHLSFNWFVCPIDNAEEFKIIETYADRVHDLRSQVTSRFRNKYWPKDSITPNEKEDELSGTFEIEHVYSETKWGNLLGEEFPLPPNENEIPYGSSFFLQIKIKIKIRSSLPRLVEEIWVDLAGKHIKAWDWTPERINQKEIDLYFRLNHSPIRYGKQPTILCVRVLGPNGKEVKKQSQSFDVIIARSYSELQRLSGAP